MSILIFRFPRWRLIFILGLLQTVRNSGSRTFLVKIGHVFGGRARLILKIFLVMLTPLSPRGRTTRRRFPTRKSPLRFVIIRRVTGVIGL